MKKSVSVLCAVGFGLMLLSGCATNKKIYERGWVGGEYLESSPSFLKKLTKNYFKKKGSVIPVLPEKINDQQSGGVFVTRVFQNTPLQKAGIEEGDLIFAADGKLMEDLNEFRDAVDQAKPGEEIILSVYRAGKVREIPVVVGKERYEKWGYFNLGMRLSDEVALFPTPDFNILNLVSFQDNDTRLELHSPEYKYYRQTLDLEQDETGRIHPDNIPNAEGWEFWVFVCGLEKKKIIVSQETWQ